MMQPIFINVLNGIKPGQVELSPPRIADADLSVVLDESEEMQRQEWDEVAEAVADMESTTVSATVAERPSTKDWWNASVKA